MTLSLTGQVAVITGASAGIGLSIAQRFAAAGASIILSGRNERRGDDARRMLCESGAEAKFVKADVSREEEVAALMEAAMAEFGAISILVNNAGPAGDDFGLAPVHELSTDIFERTVRIGMFGPFWCCKYALPHMMAARQGNILNISAIAATRAIPNMGAYAMAKAPLEALSRQVANDYAGYGIRANTLLVGTVRPGPDDVTTLPAGFDHASLDGAIGRTTMLGTVGQYADVSAAALFLASPESRYITGSSLPVEGGALGKLLYPTYDEAMAATDFNTQA